MLSPVVPKSIPKPERPPDQHGQQQRWGCPSSRRLHHGSHEDCKLSGDECAEEQSHPPPGRTIEKYLWRRSADHNPGCIRVKALDAQHLAAWMSLDRESFRSSCNPGWRSGRPVARRHSEIPGDVLDAVLETLLTVAQCFDVLLKRIEPDHHLLRQVANRL